MPEDLADLDRRITSALSALRRARAVAGPSAVGPTRWREDEAERVLNDLLDHRFRAALSEGAAVLAGAAAGRR